MIESVPNISEGRNRETIEAVAAAIRETPQVYLLHVTSDVDHNRSVLTLVSNSADAMHSATVRMFEAALSRIDLRNHQGEHPRVGAVDVVPFVPLGTALMEQCAELAERVGSDVATRFDLPVYLYEHAAKHDYRRTLPAIRSGGFENFARKLEDPRWVPDFGPRRIHPRAGASIIGARVPLIAFNVQLRSDDMEIATRIARAVRASSGGLPYVRALPIYLAHRGVVQVSMNLLDYRHTSMDQTFSAVRKEAASHGVEILSSEIVGLVPAAALPPDAQRRFRLEHYTPEMILERRIETVTGQRM